jgi:hypothetical protein
MFSIYEVLPAMMTLLGLNTMVSVPAGKTEKDRAADDNCSVYVPKCPAGTVDLGF